MKTKAEGIPSTVHAINQLPPLEKRAIYARLVPEEILQRFKLSPDLYDQHGNDLIQLDCKPGSSDAEMGIYHQAGFPDPILYGHITDTLANQIHILLYIINDPDSERFQVDRLPDGTPTMLGAAIRHLPEEERALKAGLAPGQVRRGLRLLQHATDKFESFVQGLGHDLYFAEPLFYHAAVLFERNGFAYVHGKALMDRIAKGFAPGGDLRPLMDNTNPFRRSDGVDSIRLRSWAIHDNILGEPFTNVSMYKMIGKSANVNTSGDCNW